MLKQSKKIFLIIILLIVFLGLFSIILFLNQEKYKYEEGFAMYVHDVFNIDIYNIKKNSSFFIIPVSSCTPCVDNALTQIYNLNHTTSIIIIIIGTTTDKNINQKIERIKEKYDTIFWDINDSIIYYETDIGLPTFIHKGQKHLYEKTDITNEKFEHIADKYFN